MKQINILFSSIPILAIIIFETFVIRATINLGHIPKPYLTDPKELGFIFHHKLIDTSLIITFIAFIIFTLIHTIPVLRKKFIRPRISIKVFIIFFLFFLLLIADPYSLFKWYLD